ncbi:MAG: DUF1592 domain-containing protein [Myxococcales bacterium]|nr:MAG: DUF1592 domain-containing protein [Myxococcales bacterium]
MEAASGSRKFGRMADFLLALGALGLASCGQTQARGKPSAEGGASAAGKASHGGGGSAGTNGAGGSGSTGVVSFEPSGAPIYTRAQRLTASQFEHAAIDILRLPATTELQTGVATQPGITTFDNNERALVVDPKNFLAFEEAAERAAALAMASPEARERLYAGTDAAGFVREVGRRAFRRPLSDEEVDRYTGLFARGEALYGAAFENAAPLVIRALLSSPSFLYRTELGPSGEPLSGYEIASKLSFWLRDTTPSDELLDAAAKGELDEPEALVAIARGMLEEPAASSKMLDFHSQLYRLNRFDELTKAGVPAWTDALAIEAKQASQRFFEGIFSENLGLREILTSSRGFVGPLLAPLYMQDAPTALEERELGPQRIGYFMQAPPLMLTGVNATPNILQRGADIAQQVLCFTLPSPPPDIPPPPSLGPGSTNRQRTAEYTETCGLACHNELINPLGYAFEGFDGLGAGRDTDKGQPIDASGSFGLSGPVNTFSDARELMNLLAQDPQPYACYGQMLASYALQRDLVPGDMPLIEELGAMGSNGSSSSGIQDIALALVRHPTFRLRSEDLP